MQLARRLSVMQLGRRLSLQPDEAHIREPHISDKTCRSDPRGVFGGVLLGRILVVLWIYSILKLEVVPDHPQLLVELFEVAVVAVHNPGAPLQHLGPDVSGQVVREDQPPSRLKGREERVRLKEQTRKVNDGEHTTVLRVTLVRNKRRFLHNSALLCARQRPARVCEQCDQAGVEAVESYAVFE
jgi:hypothetical protein